MGRLDKNGGSRKFITALASKPYVLSQFPVTVAQYSLFSKSGGYKVEKFWSDAGWDFIREGRFVSAEMCDDASKEYSGWLKQSEKKFPLSEPAEFPLVYRVPNHPCVGVSWFEAVAYCNWLNKSFDASELGLPKGWFVRLPTEAEWEQAATNAGKTLFPWGDSLEDIGLRCNVEVTGLRHSSAVGLFGRNGRASCNVDDLAGNIWEWCGTRWFASYENYEVRPEVASELRPKSWRTLLEGPHYRVLRGGSRFDGVESVKGTHRNGERPILRYNNIGFRLAASKHKMERSNL
jgi:formylglycine-generating enzyme required for sulfatase activity